MVDLWLPESTGAYHHRKVEMRWAIVFFILFFIWLTLYAPVVSAAPVDADGPPVYVTRQELQQIINERNRYRDNFITLKEYVDSRFASAGSALRAAKADMEKRLDGMNEFRASLRDQANMFASKAGFDALRSKVDNMVSKGEFDSLRSKTDTIVGKSEFNAVMKKVDEADKRAQDDIKDLQLSRAEISGKASQSSATIAMGMGLLGMCLAIASLIISVLKIRRRQEDYGEHIAIHK